MNPDARNITIKILKCLFLLACCSILFSVYWLRPLMNEGSRYTITLIQNMEPFLDNVNLRFLLVPFQLPAIVAMKMIPDIEPLTVARLYFFSIFIPVVFGIGAIFFRLKDQRKILTAALVFFVVFLPGMNFQLSHINETFLIFILSALCALRQKIYLYSGLSFLAILGHPGVLGPNILMAFFFLIEVYHFKKPEYRKFLFVTIMIILILILKISFTLFFFPFLGGSYFSTLKMHLSNITQSNQDFITAAYMLLFTFFMALIPGTKKISTFVSIFTAIVFLFFIYREKSYEIFHNAYQYRVFSVCFFCALMLYSWLVFRWKLNPVSQLPGVCLIILASWFTTREVKASMWFWRDAPQLVKLDLPPGCHYTAENSAYLYTSMPIYRMFLSNKRRVNSTLFSDQYDPERKLCSAFDGSSFPYEISPTGETYRYQFPHDGFFSLAPMN